MSTKNCQILIICQNRGMKYEVRGISFPDKTLLEYAREQAKAENRSLSNWVCGLIREHRDRQLRLNEPGSYGRVSSKPQRATGRLAAAAGKPADPAP